MTVLTGEDLANLTGTTPSPQTGSIVIEADEFVGRLIGEAVMAKKLSNAITLSLTGDAEGSVSIDGSANKTLIVVVRNAEHATTADYAGQVQVAERASLADLANLATFALKAGSLTTFKIKFTGDLISGEGELNEDGQSVDVAVDFLNISKGSIVFMLNAGQNLPSLDTSKMYVDLLNNELWIYDFANEEWKNLFEVFKEHFNSLDASVVQINDHLISIDGQIVGINNTLNDLQGQINSNDDDITSINDRLGVLSSNFEINFNGNTYQV